MNGGSGCEVLIASFESGDDVQFPHPNGQGHVRLIKGDHSFDLERVIVRTATESATPTEICRVSLSGWVGPRKLRKQLAKCPSLRIMGFGIRRKLPGDGVKILCGSQYDHR